MTPNQLIYTNDTKLTDLHFTLMTPNQLIYTNDTKSTDLHS